MKNLFSRYFIIFLIIPIVLVSGCSSFNSPPQDTVTISNIELPSYSNITSQVKPLANFVCFSGNMSVENDVDAIKLFQKSAILMKTFKINKIFSISKPFKLLTKDYNRLSKEWNKNVETACLIDNGNVNEAIQKEFIRKTSGIVFKSTYVFIKSTNRQSAAAFIFAFDEIIEKLRINEASFEKCPQCSITFRIVNNVTATGEQILYTFSDEIYNLSGFIGEYSGERLFDTAMFSKEKLDNEIIPAVHDYINNASVILIKE